MYRLFPLTALLLLTNADPRTPKIYNVLISTKKNLSPSHALPIYEPVLRTTPIGIAIPPIYYQHPLFPYHSTPFANYIGRSEIVNDIPSKSIENPQEQPFPLNHFISYNYDANISNNPSEYSSTTNILQQKEPLSRHELSKEQIDDPKSVIANLKRNPEIPDVPAPAIPVKTS